MPKVTVEQLNDDGSPLDGGTVTLATIDPFKDYLSLPGTNWSTLSPMAVSPKNYRWAKDHPRPDKTSLALGRKIHTATLEPDEFAKRYVFRPSKWDSWRTKAAKKWRDDQHAEGREVLDDSESGIIESVRASIADHPKASELIDETKHEVTVQWVDEETGVECKARLDMLDWTKAGDLKTTRDLARFGPDFAKYLYQGQCAFYRDGAVAAGKLDPNATFYVVPVETNAPYDVGRLVVTEPTLEAGRNLYRSCLHQLLSCRETGHWPGMFPEDGYINLPPWAAGVRPDEEETF